MAIGFRSPFAFWTGGGGVSSTSPAVGQRSMLAPWVGGAGVPGTTTPNAGYRSLLAFWTGGTGVGAELPAPPPSPIFLALSPEMMRDLFERRVEEDDVLLLIASQIAAGIIH